MAQFADGHSKLGGRKRGTPNRATTSVKAALLEAFELRGGVLALLKWADKDPGGFYALWARLAPREVNAEVSGKGGGPVQVWSFGDKKISF